MQRTATLLVLGLLMAAPALAQPDRVGQDIVWARDIGSATITLDGTLSEPEWAAAESINIRWDAPLGLPGSGQFIEQNPFGLDEPTDPINAMVYFLRKGNDLYIAVDAEDESVGGATGLWSMDGVFMSLVSRANRPDNFNEVDDYSGFNGDGLRIRDEYFYSWWNGRDTTDTGMVAPGISPFGRSTYYGGGLDDETDARSTEAWNYASTVDGVSNDDFNGGSAFEADGGYVFEMMISVDSLGWDFNQEMTRMPLSIALQDADYSWPQDVNRYILTRAWWQSRWGNNLNEGVAFIAGDPAVTISSGAVPAYTEPEFRVPSGLNLPEPMVDGVLDEPAWGAIEPQFRMKYLADADPNDGEFLDENLPGVIAPNYYFYFHADANPVLDPTVGNFSMFYKGSMLYIGLDTDDQAVNGQQAENFRDGFRLNIRSLDSTVTGLEYTLDHVRMDFSIDSTGAVRIENLPDYVDPAGVMAAVSMKPGSTVADPSDIDAGYQMEVAVDLQELGYPADVDDSQIWISLTYFDGDSLEDDAQSYGTRAWIANERASGAIVYGFLDSNLLVNTAAGDEPAAEVLQVRSAFPNPTTGFATVRYELGRPAEVTVEVFDVLGRRVQQVAGVARGAGVHEATVDGRALSAGAYVVRVTLEDGTAATGRMLIAR